MRACRAFDSRGGRPTAGTYLTSRTSRERSLAPRPPRPPHQNQHATGLPRGTVFAAEGSLLDSTLLGQAHYSTSIQMNEPPLPAACHHLVTGAPHTRLHQVPEVPRPRLQLQPRWQTARDRRPAERHHDSPHLRPDCDVCIETTCPLAFAHTSQMGSAQSREWRRSSVPHRHQD